MQGKVIFYDKNKEVIEKLPITRLPIKEEVIIQKSIEFFNEPNPCIINRCLCINKIGFELLKQLESIDENENKITNILLTIDEIPLCLKEYLDLKSNMFNKDVFYIEIM